MASFPEEALQHVLSFINSNRDRSSVSLVCKSWYDIERWCRRHIFIGNCYAVSPAILIRRFTDVRSITIKGMHFAADFDRIPEGWGAHALTWIASLVAAYPAMEEMKFKRMVVTDEGLEMIGKEFKTLSSLILYKCKGFSTNGLASIAANCRKLRMLDLCKSEVDDLSGNWITHFPDSYTCLEFLNVDCLLKSVFALEGLVERCPNLKGLRLGPSFPLDKLLNNILPKAPAHLHDLGIASFTMDDAHIREEAFAMLATTFTRFSGLKRLSGLSDVTPYYLPTIYPLCARLSSLDLSHSTLRCPDLVKLILHCPNLRILLVLDFIEDRGLEEVASTCKELEELSVLPSDPYDVDPTINITEQGVVSVVMGCPKLHRILYFCSQLTNVALCTISKHLPNLTSLLVGTIEPQTVDYLTHQPLDTGFISIVQHCKRLERFWTTALITDRLMEKIGTFGNKLEVLGFTLCEGSDVGLHHILSGCENLRKLFIRECPFAGQAILANSDKLERLRCLWMLSCPVTYQTCKMLADKHPMLSVEINNQKGSSLLNDEYVEELYVYRTVAGTRLDMPSQSKPKSSIS